MAKAFDVSQVVAQADRLRDSAANAEKTLEHQFVRWVEDVADVMRDEIPKDTHETADSVTTDYGEGLSATIGPTNTDERGRPVGFFINYGAGGRSPDDFIGRTATRAPQSLDQLDVREVL
jgi:hypothetical protein